MAVAVSGAERARLRIHAQALDGCARSTDVVECVRRAGAVQAQDLRAAHLSVRARSGGLTTQDLRSALEDDHRLVWTWAMRGTLHLLPAADAEWMVGLLGPVFAARFRRRRVELGLDDDLCERALAAIGELLADGRSLSRPALVAELVRAGVDVPREGQGPAHLTAFAAMRGLICRSGAGSGGSAYRLLHAHTAAAPPREEESALAELARRHAAAYGPATPDDFAYWSGLPAGRARRGWELIAAELREVATPDGPAWLLADAVPPGPPPARPVVRLLGAFDAVLLGHRNREWVLPSVFARRVHPGAGVIRPVVVADGAAVARWRLDRKRKDATVVIEPFRPEWAEDPSVRDALESEAADIGRFLELSTKLHVD